MEQDADQVIEVIDWHEFSDHEPTIRFLEVEDPAGSQPEAIAKALRVVI